MDAYMRLAKAISVTEATGTTEIPWRALGKEYRHCSRSRTLNSSIIMMFALKWPRGFTSIILANTEFTLYWLMRLTQSLPPRKSRGEVLASHTTRIYSSLYFTTSEILTLRERRSNSTWNSSTPSPASTACHPSNFFKLNFTKLD